LSSYYYIRYNVGTRLKIDIKSTLLESFLVTLALWGRKTLPKEPLRTNTDLLKFIQ